MYVRVYLCICGCMCACVDLYVGSFMYALLYGPPLCRTTTKNSDGGKGEECEGVRALAKVGGEAHCAVVHISLKVPVRRSVVCTGAGPTAMTVREPAST